jgi:photosystem II stability/assembly factor-like uncharacterized protein
MTSTVTIKGIEKTKEFSRTKLPPFISSLTARPRDLKNWVKNDLDGYSIYSITIDPLTPNIFYATVFNKQSIGPYIKKSIDSGQNWIELNNNFIDIPIYDMKIDPLNPTTIYIGAYRGIYKSIDGGERWVKIFSEFSGPGINALEINPLYSSIIYAGAFAGEGYNYEGNYLYKSLDGGLNWKIIDTGVSGLDISALAINPLYTNNLYAGTSRGMFRSTNSGDEWKEINAGLPDDVWIRDIMIDPKTSTTIYLGAWDEGIYKSTDNGDRWFEINNGLPNGIRVMAIEIDPLTTTTIYIGTDLNRTGLGGGVYKSVDGGINWLNIGLLGIGTYSLAINPINPNILYAITEDGLYSILQV